MIKKIFSIWGLIVITLLLVAGYLGLWVYLKSTVTTGVSNYISELESEGYQVEHGGLSIDGFPFSINAHSPRLAVRTTPNSLAGQSGNWSFDTQNIQMSSATVTPMSWSLRHTGVLSVNSESSAFDVTPADINADVAYALTGVLKSLKANIEQAQISPRRGTQPAILGFDNLNADIKVKSGTAAIDIRAENVRLSPQILGDARGLLGEELALFSVNGDVENWQVLEVEGVEVWMQSPSKIKSDDWQLKWGNLDLVGGYELGFKNGLPEGVVRFRVKNIDAMLQSLTEMNMLDSAFAIQIRTVASGMESDEDGRKLIELTIQNGVVKYGFFTLFRF